MTDGNSELKWPKSLLLTKSNLQTQLIWAILFIGNLSCICGMLGLCALCLQMS
jgi:hypothetical protein